MKCVKSYEADYIISRNVSDYATSEIKAVTLKEYFFSIPIRFIQQEQIPLFKKLLAGKELIFEGDS